MNTNQPNQLIYSDVLSHFIPRIDGSQNVAEVDTHAAEFLIEMRQLGDPCAENTFHEEAEFLWDTFPPAAKTIARYQMLVRVLLAQAVDSSWYTGYPCYLSSRQVESDNTLVSFERFSEDFDVKFIYVRYYKHILMRVPNAVRLRYRSFTNHPGRYTQGLTVTRCKKAMAGLINQISEDVALETNTRRSFKVLVNSVLRTVTYQRTLAKIGYIAPRRSAHLAGYAVDIEKRWYEKHDYHVHMVMKQTLGDLFTRGVINLIEEDSHWHVCLNPESISHYEALSHKWEK